MSEEQIGVVDHWYGGIDVAGVTVTGQKLSVGDNIRFAGHTTDFVTEVGSMQIDHDSVLDAVKGDQVGIKVPHRVRIGDEVLLVRED
jgi:putative protease